MYVFNEVGYTVTDMVNVNVSVTAFVSGRALGETCDHSYKCRGHKFAGV